MKLWKKTVVLMLLTLLGALVLVSGLTIYIAGRQSLEKAAQTYGAQAEATAGMLEQFWDSGKYDRMSETGKKSYLNFQFRQCCPEGFILLRDGRAVENRTEYDLADPAPLGEATDEAGEYHLQYLGKKVLMLHQIRTDILENAVLLSIQDITGLYRDVLRLGLWILGINAGVFFLAGAFIYRMMRRTVERMEALQKVAEKQELLLGSLAHEMKTPLTSIIGYSDSLLHVKLPPGQQERALLHINREGKRMEKLSAKMLQLMGLYDNSAVKMELCPIREIVGQAAEAEAGKARKLGISLKTECEDFSLKIDRELLESLLLNLLDNAFHASEPGDTVILRAALEKGQKILQVKDFGRGIPGEELEHVTEAFYMVDKSRSRKNGGAGLGLALCRKIAALHGAALEIDSEEGAGTTVTVRFP